MRFERTARPPVPSQQPPALKRLYWALRRREYMAVFRQLNRSAWLDDAVTIAVARRHLCGRVPNLLRPRRFSDRIARMMLSTDGRGALRAHVTDKELVKAYVERCVGPGYTPRTLAVLRDPTEVEAFEFPPDCAIKATHDSGSVLLRRHGTPVDRARIRSWFSRNYHDVAREPNYRLLVPKIIVEELLPPPPGESDLPDFKFFCFSGQPVLVQVDADRFSDHRRSFYSRDWVELDFTMNYPATRRPVPRPAGLELMLSLAEKLSAPFSFVRVDCYQTGDRVVVGELTHFPEASHMTFSPDAADLKMGRLLDAPDLDCVVLFGGTGRQCAG